MVPDRERPPSIFTPADEPYLGLKSVFWFDRIIVATLSWNEAVAKYTRCNSGSLNSLQLAACQIVPQGISIALSIRELIRQAYLFPALVLMRPLIERAAVISYLRLNPEKADLWHEGWPRRSRPTLATMLAAMAGDAQTECAQQVCNEHNHMVHGDPFAACHNLVRLDNGELAYSSGKMLNNPDLCNNTAMEAQCYLVVLKQSMPLIFPNVDMPPDAL